eukprot:scaffold6084_cov112-Isochrysis_galbana.AAC.4
MVRGAQHDPAAKAEGEREEERQAAPAGLARAQQPPVQQPHQLAQPLHPERVVWPEGRRRAHVEGAAGERVGDDCEAALGLAGGGVAREHGPRLEPVDQLVRLGRDRLAVGRGVLAGHLNQGLLRQEQTPAGGLQLGGARARGELGGEAGTDGVEPRQQLRQHRRRRGHALPHQGGSPPGGQRARVCRRGAGRCARRESKVPVERLEGVEDGGRRRVGRRGRGAERQRDDVVDRGQQPLGQRGQQRGLEGVTQSIHLRREPRVAATERRQDARGDALAFEAGRRR